MKDQPLVTVLMPCYNASAFLFDAVSSILNQTYSNLEVLLIDDGSSDDTKELIIKYASSDNRIRPVFNEVNLGLIRTLNKGVELAQGNFIARMDSDDISDIHRIERMLEYFRIHPELDVVSAGYYSMSADGKKNVRVYPKALDSEALLFVSLFCTPVNHPCMMARSGVLKSNPFDERFIHSEDYEIFSRLLLSGSTIMNLTEPLYYLRRNPQSVSNRFEKIQIANHTRISVRNIEQYFGITFDYFIHKIMINRISFNVSPRMIRSALKNLDQLRLEYEKRENIDQNNALQIRDFLIEQRIDIFLQSLKYASWTNRIGIILLIFATIRDLISKRTVQYIKSKVR